MCILGSKVPSAGSVDKRFAIWAAEASRPSQSSAPPSEISPISNPGNISIRDKIWLMK